MTESTMARYETRGQVSSSLAASRAPQRDVSKELRTERSQRLVIKRQPVALEDMKRLLTQDPVIFAHLMNGTSPFGKSTPVSSTWRQDGENFALKLMHRINALTPDENGVTMVIACDGAYQKGTIGHLMLWNVWVHNGQLKLQTGNQENIAGKHYPTKNVNTVELWKRHDPAGSANSNHAGLPVDAFSRTPIGISVARHGLFINLFAATASENFEAEIARLSMTEAGQPFGFFDGQKSCFTTARDLLGATGTKGPDGERIDWMAGKPEPVIPDILNKLSRVTNNERQVHVEIVQGKTYDLHDAATRRLIDHDKRLYARLAVRLGRWINKNAGAYQTVIRPAI